MSRYRYRYWHFPLYLDGGVPAKNRLQVEISNVGEIDAVGRELKISAKLINNKVVFKVQDNGYGMKNERIEEIYTRFRNPDLNDGVGLKNVYLRLKIYYGDEADLLIDSELDEGTVITIIIPPKVN